MIYFRTVYSDCVTQNTANTCQRNAECITTSGASLWCTGPKIGSCFLFARHIARTWTTAVVSLRTPRAFAASVFLPDGRTWVLGGAGSTNILKTTEFITLDEMSRLQIVPGPDMLEPLMYHSAAWISTTQVSINILQVAFCAKVFEKLFSNHSLVPKLLIKFW